MCQQFPHICGGRSLSAASAKSFQRPYYYALMRGILSGWLAGLSIAPPQNYYCRSRIDLFSIAFA